MSAHGEWIDFEELCRRLPGKSARTLRRLYKEKQVISFRQTVRGGRVEFNWHTVRRELAVHETRGVHAARAAAIEDMSQGEMRTEIAHLRSTVDLIAKHLGLPTELSPAP